MGGKKTQGRQAALIAAEWSKTEEKGKAMPLKLRQESRQVQQWRLAHMIDRDSTHDCMAKIWGGGGSVHRTSEKA